MTRKEQIEKLAEIEGDNTSFDAASTKDEIALFKTGVEIGFKFGARWADLNPQETSEIHSKLKIAIETLEPFSGRDGFEEVNEALAKIRGEK